MNARSHIKNTILSTAMLLIAAGGAQADTVDLAQVLHGGPSCEHVIHLMLRHGIGNTHGLTTGNVVQHSSLGPMLVPAAELGDLELLQVAQLQIDDPACGPKFAVTVRNNSTRDVCGFRISLVALLGRINPMAPTAIVKVNKICAGQVAEVHVQLPIEALAMGNRGGQVIGFQRLLVAIDSYDQFVESIETNNIKVLARTAIPMATVLEKSVETVDQTVSTTAPSTAVPPGDEVSGASQPASTASPPPGPAPSGPSTTAPANDLQNAINQLSEQQKEPAAAENAAATR